jgi:hypothetical protein
MMFAGLACSPGSYLLKHKPELAKTSFQYFAMKSEEKIAKSPNDPTRLLAGCETLTKFAFGFIMEDADRMAMVDYSAGKVLYQNAHSTFSKAVIYGDRAMTIKYPTYAKWLIDKDGKTPPFNKADVPYLFWTAGAYGGAIKSSKGNPEWIIKLPRIGLLLEAALQIEPTWNKGSINSAMISYTMIRHDAPLNREEVARKYFKMAIDASHDLDLGPYVTLAESVAIPTQNRNEFTNLLYKALNIDMKADPDLALTNQINRNRAQWLMDNIDEFFF